MIHGEKFINSMFFSPTPRGICGSNAGKNFTVLFGCGGGACGTTNKEVVEMEKLEPYFPLNKSVKSSEVGSLVVAIVIYVVIAAVLGVLLGFLSGIPVLGIIFSIVSTLVWIYEVVGIVLAVMTFIK